MPVGSGNWMPGMDMSVLICNRVYMFKKLHKKIDERRDLLAWAGQLEAVTGIPKERIADDQAALWRDHLITRDEYAEFRLCCAPAALHDNFLGLNEQRPYLDLLNPKRYYILSRNKFLANRLFAMSGIPSAELLCCYRPEGQVLTDSLIVNDLQGVLTRLSKQSASAFVVKAAEGAHGHNVCLFKVMEYGKDEVWLRRFDGQEMPLSSLLGNETLVFEQAVKQTAQFASFNPSSVNTIRFMTTLFPDGRVQIIAAFIKIGRAGHCVDNAGDGGNVDACIDTNTGEIVFALQYDGIDNIREVECHPDSGARLKGVMVENWSYIKQRVCSFQRAYPYCKAPGWDIAITAAGPVVIEVNDFWDRTGQLFIQRGWRKEIRDCWLAWRATGKEWIFGRDYNHLPWSRISEVISEKK